MDRPKEKGKEGNTHKLSNEEGTDKEETRALYVGPASGPGHKDQGLADDTDLEIQCCHLLMLASSKRPHTEFILYISTGTIKTRLEPMI